MEYKKKLNLKGMIFTKDDLLRFAKFLADKKKNSKDDIKIEIYFDDDSQILSNEIDIFDKDYIVEREISAVTMYYRTADYEKIVDIDIRSSKHLDSTINIKSNEEEWFLSALKMIEDKIHGIKKQNFMWKVSNTPLLISIIPAIISFSTIVIMQMCKIINLKELSTSTYFCTYIFLVLITTIILYKISSLFPCIEFDININNVSSKKKIRKVIV
ncbi:MAG: hypothetical protein RSE41_05965 [Clostridia bacterium]